MDDLPPIDWDAAVQGASLVLPAGPRLDAGEVEAVVAELRDAAARASEHVARVTQLDQPADSQVLVVDRANWLKAAAGSAEVLLGGVSVAPSSPQGGWAAAKARALGLQVGGVLALISTRILGQFDPFAQPKRLLLVAPNVVNVERSLGALPSDFRLWVCLHEETHRFQFGHAPWLGDHLLGLVGQLLDGGDLTMGWLSDPDGRRGVGSADQRAAFDALTAVMSLLEGHADVMMDRVGVEVVPSYASIRHSFDQRRQSRGWLSVVQKLLGLELKDAQYREGAQFCRTVIAEADLVTLNRAFASADQLPTLAELRDPQRWLQRVG